MINLKNVTLVSIDSAADFPNKSNIRLAAISRIIPELSKYINFGDLFILNPFSKNKDLLNEKFDTLWPHDWKNSGPISWYNNFLIKKLPHLINTEWYLIVQWDGFPRWNECRWNDEFFNYPYIGGGHSLLNGGFSLRNTEIMKKMSECNDSFNTGAEDGFYSKFLDNEFTKNINTPFKIPMPTQKIINDFCFFQDVEYNNNQNTFGWHRSGFLSKEKIKMMFNQTYLFSEKEIDKLTDYCLLKELRNEIVNLSGLHSIYNIDYNQPFFDTY